MEISILSLKKKNTLIASCPKGLEPALQSDIEALGFSIIKIAPRAVYFTTDEVGFYKAHLGLRTASSIKLVLKSFESNGTDELFARCEKIAWEKLLPKNVPVNTQVQVSKDFNPKEVFEVFKRGIETRFLVRSGATPVFGNKDNSIDIFVYQYNDQWTFSIDTTGKALHKRGYRVEGHPAPLKENLAAGLLRLGGYKGQKNLLDPMMGSGTAVIEAAMIQLRKAPLIHRKKGGFAFEAMPFFKNSVYRQAQDECRERKLSDLVFPIWGRDVHPDFVKGAKENALKARVEKHLDLNQLQFFESKKPSEHGLMFTNLPYDQRLKKKENFFECFSEHITKEYAGWDFAIYAYEDTFKAPQKAEALKVFDVPNGSLETKLWCFKL